ncbi:IS3 family transposase [Streptomyces capillispiralis]|uniref:IS3 family transposase n=1 Tax=Streptomyces capillispiralis TaxID=68182 RepID=UPI003692AFAF
MGSSYDNALAEDLWILIKTEGLRGRTFATRAEANLVLFEYIDGFYNSRRIREPLGWLSPIEFEEKHYAEQAAAEQVNLKPCQPTLISTSRATGEPQVEDQAGAGSLGRGPVVAGCKRRGRRRRG